MPKYFDGLGNDVTHWVETLLEKVAKAEAESNALDLVKKEVSKLKAENKRLNKKIKEIE
jgi:hypothetical protein